MADTVYQKFDPGTQAWKAVKLHDNGDGTYSEQTMISANSTVAATDKGPAQTVTRTYTTSANMTTPAAITAAPTSGQKIVAMDILISTDTAMSFDVEMETSANVLAQVYLPANGTAQITLRGYLKGDAANEKLNGKASEAGNVAVTAVYFSEA